MKKSQESYSSTNISWRFQWRYSKFKSLFIYYCENWIIKKLKLKDKKVTWKKVYLIFLFSGDGGKKGYYILINEWQIVANW